MRGEEIVEKYIIALQQLGIKNEILIKLVTQYSSADIELIFKDVKNSIFLTNIEFANLSKIYDNPDKMEAALKYADSILNKNQELDIKVSIYGDENYPSNFYTMQAPPVLIYYKGAHIGKNYDKAIACVGTRKPTKLSYNIINYLVPQLVEEGYTIVSGLALGSDRLAHISTLMCGGNTIAVLAHGLDQVSPKKNKRLADDILDNGGTLISEYPVGVKPENFRYINRNRLIVGLAKGLIVGECAKKSGTMHSVQFSKENNRNIFCANPGIIITEEQEGVKLLLDDKIAIEIPNGRAYDIIVEKTGYRCEAQKLKVEYINGIYLKSLLYNLWDNQKMYDEIVTRYDKNFIGNQLWKNNGNTPIEVTGDILQELLQICVENKIAD